MRTSLATLRVFASRRGIGQYSSRRRTAGPHTILRFGETEAVRAGNRRPLFESGRKNRLTPVGSFVHTQVRDLLGHVDRKLASLQAYSRNAIGRIDIASVPSIATTLLPAVIARFRSQWPAVEITARDADSRSVADLVQSGTVELGIASMPSERRALRVYAAIRGAAWHRVPQGRPAISQARRPALVGSGRSHAARECDFRRA